MRLRAPVIDDAPAVLEVLIARDIADTGEPDSTREDLLKEWRSREVDLALDVRVAELNGRIVGYSVVQRRGAMIAIDPRFEGRGAGAPLLRWAQARERERGRHTHRQWLGAADEELRGVLIAAGYTQVRSYWRMVRELDGSEQPAPVIPDGVRLRALDLEADAVAVHALDDRSFSTVPDYDPSTFEQFRDEHLAAHDLDPGLSVIAEAAGAMAGFLLTRVWPEQSAGFVEILAVHPDHQGRGVGTALLRRAFAGYAGAGLREAQLGVASDNPRAFELYERVGMRQKFRFDVYEREVG
jgi:mycothiol synthase